MEKIARHEGQKCSYRYKNGSKNSPSLLVSFHFYFISLGKNLKALDPHRQTVINEIPLAHP